jgi:hypothetical protein
MNLTFGAAAGCSCQGQRQQPSCLTGSKLVVLFLISNLLTCKTAVFKPSNNWSSVDSEACPWTGHNALNPHSYQTRLGLAYRNIQAIILPKRFILNKFDNSIPVF